ncbi:MAG: hypothetical protein HFF45_12875 [Lawsonibacter sp.]|jgi:Zn-dependent membrane protease YugP|nr:hypothetical protein [Lawsonibacter sp.]
MKPKSTEKRAVIKSAALSILFQLFSVGVLLYARTLIQTGWLRTLALVLAVGDIITIPFTFAALRQRMREIEKGELDEARKY